MTSGIHRLRRFAVPTPLVLGAVVFAACAALAAPLGCSSGSSGSGGNPGGSDGGGGGGGGGGASGSVGALCSASAPCATGLSCAQSGTLLGRCTADCSANLALCASQFGSNTLCLNASQCALICTSPSECPGSGWCVSLSSGESACITDPNGGPGAAAPPNGGCTNLGGAFGDTVSNGGYRCTPTMGNGPITGIDKCLNGTWVSALSCTCKVTSSISGGQDPSDCTDFNAPDTARCSYALDYCEQCDPSGGCQAH